MTYGGGKAPVVKRNQRKRPTLLGPFAVIILRESSPRRSDFLNYSVEVRPIGTKGNYDHVVARFKDPDDAKHYGAILARRSKCRINDYVQKPMEEKA